MMVEKIKKLLGNEGIDLCVFLPLDKCVITKKYLALRACPPKTGGQYLVI